MQVSLPTAVLAERLRLRQNRIFREDSPGRLASVGGELCAAAVVIALMVAISVAIVVFKIRSDREEETPAETDLTYRLRNRTAPATSDTKRATDLETKEETEEATTSHMSTRTTREILDRQTLFCTYGTRTAQGMLFPDDGLCDLMYFDSVYKGNQNFLSEPERFSENLQTFLKNTAAYKQTEVGVAFAYEKVANLRAEFNKSTARPLVTFWKKGVVNFGIVDMPAFGVKDRDISQVFLALRELSKAANENRNVLKPPHIVLGAVPFGLEDYYGNKIRNTLAFACRDVQDPTLFITRSHYAFGDNEVSDCMVLPPTILLKPYGSLSYYYDLRDAASALRKMQMVAGSIKWLISVGMKGRWTKVKPDAPMRLGSECQQDVHALSFGSYTQVCRDTKLRPHFQYDPRYQAVGSRDSTRQHMFVYDNEEGLCRKLCSIKAQNSALRFGVAVYDLDYEDDKDTCADLNKFGAFSRLKMVRHVVDYYGSLPADASDCVDAIPCVSHAQ